MTTQYTVSEINDQLLLLNKNNDDTPWEIKDRKLYKSFVFTNFTNAFSFMTKIAIQAEKSNHHPEWFNVYNRVEIYLITHEASGLSSKDFELARVINIYKK